MQSHPASHEGKESTMYRLMQSVKFTLEPPTLGPIPQPSRWSHQEIVTGCVSA
jgi:hypothetical protein